MEWAKLLVAAAAIFTTVSIAIGGWVLQRQKELQTADKKTSALYVNPFLDACNDLQGRIYNILMLDGLGPTTAKRNTSVGLCFSSLSILDGSDS
tara:strand:+ start:177 stop:458 length:282 start_codon:yes stop_codon:yes gene_type:complete